jgi:ceramide glucosyltransferase
MNLLTGTEPLQPLADLCLAAAGLGCLYLLIACVAVLRFPKRRSHAAVAPVPVTFLKPLCGVEPGLPDRLNAFCTQEYDPPVQLVCGIADRADAAGEAVFQSGGMKSSGASGRARLSAIDIVIDGRRHGTNLKVSNLINMLSLARHDVLVLSDSDITVGPGYLDGVVAELQRPGIGAVTCLYHGVPAAGIWARQAALAINSHFLPNVVAAVSFGLAQPCFGSTIAIRRDTLAGLGGLQSFADCLADDYAIGEAVRAGGSEVAITPFSVGHVCFQNSFRDLAGQEIRTARTIRSIEPIGYCGTILSHPFPLALAGALFGGGDGLLLAAMALTCRAVLCLCVEQAFGVARQPYWLIPLRELMSFSVFVCSFFGATVTWRGICHRIGSGGRLLTFEAGQGHDADAVPPGPRL